MAFLVGTIPYVSQLAAAFRAAGRPVIYVAHVLKPDYSDAAFPYPGDWDYSLQPGITRTASREPGARRS